MVLIDAHGSGGAIESLSETVGAILTSLGQF